MVGLSDHKLFKINRFTQINSSCFGDSNYVMLSNFTKFTNKFFDAKKLSSNTTRFPKTPNAKNGGTISEAHLKYD